MPVRPSWHTARNRKICADRKRDVDFQGLLPTRQRAKVGHGPVQVDEVEQAFDEPGGLSECHPEQHLHRQASLDGCVTVIRLTTALAGRCCSPGHVGIEPDRQRTAALERCVVVRPVSGLVGRGYGSAHALQLPCWIHEMNPSPDLCNRARGGSSQAPRQLRRPRADAAERPKAERLLETPLRLMPRFRKG